MSLRDATPFSNSKAARFAASLIPISASTGFAVDRTLSLASGSVSGAKLKVGCIMLRAEGPDEPAGVVEVEIVPKDGIRELNREASVLANAVKCDVELDANVVARWAPAAISST